MDADPQQLRLYERLGAIEAKLDLFLAAEIDKEQRLRVLEKRDAYVLGVAAIVSMLAPVIFKYVLKL